MQTNQVGRFGGSKVNINLVLLTKWVNRIRSMEENFVMI